MSGNAQQAGAVLTHFRRVSSEWNDRYEHAPRRMSDLDLQLRRAAAVDLLKPALEMAAEVPNLLDVGCGSGCLLKLLNSERVKLHGVDLVPEMVREAGRRAPQAELHVAEAGHLPWPDGSMQVVTCLGVLEYLQCPQAGLGEMQRVLAPGGVLIASFPNRLSLLRRLSRWEIALENVSAQALKRLRRKSPDSTPYRPYVHRDRSASEARRILDLAGFDVEVVRCVTYGFWGHLGCNRPAIRLSRALSHYLAKPTLAARYLACTLLFQARKRTSNRGPSAS